MDSAIINGIVVFGLLCFAIYWYIKSDRVPPYL